jgi:CubicO group peptidase (beta-lactamase class C family)
LKTLRILGIFLLVPLGLFGLVILISFALYPREYVLRLLRWGEADVYDHQRFASRPLLPAPQPYLFPASLDETRVRAAFEADPRIDNLDQFLEQNHTQALLVLQDGELVYERYFNGANRETIVTSFSVAKSFVSAMIGIAIEAGQIASVDDPITEYLPELAQRDPAFSQISIRNLLRMDSGIRYKEFPFFNGDDAKTYYYPDLRVLALEQTRIETQPGLNWVYNNYHPLLLGLIIERATGKSVAQVLEEEIWQPVGAQYEGSWSLDSPQTGFEKMESGINARAIDFARFGQLYLQNGTWQGRQVVPGDWIAESTSPPQDINPQSYYPPDTFLANGDGFYKYMWWGLYRDGGYDYTAAGNFGQYIYVSPANQVVIVRNGIDYGISNYQWQQIFFQAAGQLQD